MRDVLVINSYAGSLVLGAQMARVPVLASMEDCGYGIAAQKLNFPGLRYVDRHPWPERFDKIKNPPLYDTVVIAHPPCAAFSNMNIVADKKGVDTDAVECHRKVMDYALGKKCEALAIESVPGALKYAQQMYLDYANKYGYDCVFVLLNAVSFGVPQWRPRVWMLFFRDKLYTPGYKFSLTPRYASLGSVLNGQPADDEVTLKHVRYLKKKYDAAGFDFEGMMRSDEVGPGGFDKIARQFLPNKDLTPEQIKEATGTLGLYRAGLPRKLDPTIFAPVILGFTLWYVQDRPLNRIEYQRIMGFPDDWRWPHKEGKDFLTYLSKGVCPPVAAWILEQFKFNLVPDFVVLMTHTCAPGQVLDLQPQKKDVEDLLRNPAGIMMPVREGGGGSPGINGPPLLTTPQTEGPDTSEGLTTVVRASKPFTCQVTFSERPQEGDVFEYKNSGTRYLELRLRRRAKEYAEVVREVPELGEGQLSDATGVPDLPGEGSEGEATEASEVEVGWGNYRG